MNSAATHTSKAVFQTLSSFRLRVWERDYKKQQLIFLNTFTAYPEGSRVLKYCFWNHDVLTGNVVPFGVYQGDEVVMEMGSSSSNVSTQVDETLACLGHTDNLLGCCHDISQLQRQ